MSISVVGTVFLLWWVISSRASSRGRVCVLGASAAFPTTAAVSVGDQGIPPFYMLSVLIAFGVVGSMVVGRERVPEYPRYSSAFFLWTLTITAVAPLLFSGMLVLDPRSGIDAQVLDPSPLHYGISMVAQTVYLLLALTTSAWIGSFNRLSSDSLGLGFFVGNGLSALREILLMIDAPWPSGLFENYGYVNYNVWDERNRGVFSEPSFLGEFAFVGLVFACFMTFHSSGRRRFFYLGLLVLSGFNVATSESWTAFASLAVLSIVAVFVQLIRALRGRGRVVWPLVGAGTAFVALVLSWGRLQGILLGMLSKKTDSDSLSNRLTADLFSFGITIRTFGLGSGLGSSRPSGFMAMLVSNIGVLGLFLFLLLIVTCVRRASRDSFEVNGFVWALVALLVAKAFAEPSLSTPLMWFLVGLLHSHRGPQTVRIGRKDVMSQEFGDSSVSGLR